MNTFQHSAEDREFYLSEIFNAARDCSIKHLFSMISLALDAGIDGEKIACTAYDGVDYSMDYDDILPPVQNLLCSLGL